MITCEQIKNFQGFCVAITQLDLPDLETVGRCLGIRIDQKNKLDACDTVIYGVAALSTQMEYGVPLKGWN